MARMTKAKKKETKTTKGRSEEGRNESKRPRVAGKGFVGKGLTKNEQKAVGKKVAPYAALAVPGGLGVKAAVKGAKAVKAAKAAKAAKKTSKPKVNLPPPPTNTSPKSAVKIAEEKRKAESIARAKAHREKIKKENIELGKKDAERLRKLKETNQNSGLRRNYGGWMA